MNTRITNGVFEIQTARVLLRKIISSFFLRKRAGVMTRFESRLTAPIIFRSKY
jgi:hypothetical protein